MSSINFRIGNTYTSLPNSRAQWDRTRTHRKIHEWTLYVDILSMSESDADLVKKVEFHLGGSFEPTKFVSYCPIKESDSSSGSGGGSGGYRWRFQTKQTSYGSVSARIAIVGRGGTVLRREFRVVCSHGGGTANIDTFREHSPTAALSPVPMENVDFGIELELSTSSSVTTSDVANAISENATVTVLDMMGDYAGARNRNDVWRIMHDRSLTCPREHGADCNKFELVSPILRGGDGLGVVDRVMHALGNISSVKVNSSMGFHIHVNVESLSLSKLKNVCQNFVKYESAMDMLMPPSRRSNEYCQSNKLAVASGVVYLAANTQYLHQKIDACTSRKQLGELVSPTKYYKLNMGPLTSDRQPTIEFRQHSSTYQRDKVKNWIRFCVAFVYNSAKYRPPAHLTKSYSDTELYDMMMMYVVKDRSLRDYYRGRKMEHANNNGDACCDGCATGTGCAAHRHVMK